MSQNKPEPNVDGMVTVYEGIEDDGIGYGTIKSGHFFLTKEDCADHGYQFVKFRPVQCAKLNGNYYELFSTAPLKIHGEHQVIENLKEHMKHMTAEEKTVIREYFLKNESID
jgi:hypothetical protein